MQAAWLYGSALALDILQAKPLRISELANLDLQRHFRRDQHGQITGIFVRATETKVRTGRDIEAVIEPPLAKAIETYLKLHRECLVVSSTTKLFPGRVGDAMLPECLSRKVTKLVQKRLGARFNAHLVRHLVATLLIDDDPANAVVAQQQLGHSDLKTTMRAYAAQRTRGAQRKYAEVLARRIGRLLPGSEQSPPRGRE